MVSRRRLLQFFSIVLAVAILYCIPIYNKQKPELYTITVAVSETPLSAPFFVAQQQGFFRDNGLDVKIIPCFGGVKCADLLKNKSVDYATASETVALFQYDKNSNVEIVSSFVKSYNDMKLLTLEPVGLKEIKDLSNKKVGIVKGSASEFYFDLQLISQSLQGIPVERVYLEPNNVIPALLSYQVDAVSIWEPYGFLSKVKSTVPVNNIGMSNIHQLSFNLIRKKREIYDLDKEVALLDALSNAIDWMNENKEPAILLVSKKLDVNIEQIRWGWDDYLFLLTNDISLISNIQAQYRWSSINGKLNSKTLDVRNIISRTSYDIYQKKVYE